MNPSNDPHLINRLLHRFTAARSRLVIDPRELSRFDQPSSRIVLFTGRAIIINRAPTLKPSASLDQPNGNHQTQSVP